MRTSLQAAGIFVTELNLPSAAWITNFIDTNEGCDYCSDELVFNDGSFACQIDAIHPHARGGPGYTKENMVPVSCFAFTLFMLLLTHSLLSFQQCCTFCNRAKGADTLEAFLGYTRRIREDQHKARLGVVRILLTSCTWCATCHPVRM
jgi:hypothetical protein